MNRQTLVVVVAAIVLLGLGVFAAMAYTGGDAGTRMMTMPDGSTMPADQMTTDGTMTMEDGSMMDDDDMTTP